MNEPVVNYDIDFLPADYRQQVASRKSHSRLAIVLLSYGIFTATILVYQNIADRSLRSRFAITEPRYVVAQSKTKRLAELQSQLTQANDLADYAAYLQHPWPRSQLLLALTAQLPPEVCLSEVELAREKLPSPDHAEPQRIVTTADSKDKKKTLTVREELQRLRQEIDGSHLILKVRGLTSDPAALHRGLAALNKTRLFTKTELGSVDAARTDDPSRDALFELRLDVLPGYGQPGGPNVPSGEQVAGQP